MSDSHETKALAIIPRTIAELVSLAELLAKSELLPKALRGKVPDVAMTIMAGQEMGFTPMAALRNFHVIEGKPVLSSDGMVALAMGSGLCHYFRRVEEADDKVTYETQRVGEDKPKRCTWTKEMAKVAGLNTKDNWRLYPRQMLAARAKSELARDVYPDVLAGCVSTEEHADWTPPDRGDVIDAEIVSETVNEPIPHEILALEHTKSEAEVKGMATVLKALPQKWKALANEKFKARLEVHRAEQKAAETKTEGAA